MAAKKILIIDDDPIIVQYLTNLFMNNGYETCSAECGDIKALEMIEKSKPDLITLDLQMPDGWGPRFYRKIRKNKSFRDIPVIVISGLSGNKYSLPKVAAHVTKPFDPDKLLLIVKKTIED